jgi:hypothetical protein
MSGDLADWFNEKMHRNFFQDLRDVMVTCNVPIFTTPGNHERYAHRLLLLYYPYDNLAYYHQYLNPLNDYALEYSSCNFVFLDSGYDYSRWEIQHPIWNPTPEASGLTDTQMYLLEHELGNNHLNQIIIMHHPGVNDINDHGLFPLHNTLPSGNNDCIAFNRGEFINYCLSHNVSLALAGHTHENNVFNSSGKTPDTLSKWPLFVQTASSTLSKENNGGRVIKMNNSVVESFEYVPFH